MLEIDHLDLTSCTAGSPQTTIEVGAFRPQPWITCKEIEIYRSIPDHDIWTVSSILVLPTSEIIPTDRDGEAARAFKFNVTGVSVILMYPKYMILKATINSDVDESFFIPTKDLDRFKDAEMIPGRVPVVKECLPPHDQELQDRLSGKTIFIRIRH